MGPLSFGMRPSLFISGKGVPGSLLISVLMSVLTLKSSTLGILAAFDSISDSRWLLRRLFRLLSLSLLLDLDLSLW